MSEISSKLPAQDDPSYAVAKAGSSAANDNHHPLDEFVAGYLKAAEQRGVPVHRVFGSRRRSRPSEVRRARRRAYLIGSVLLALWAAAFLLPLLQRLPD